MSVVVYIDHADGKIKKTSFEAVSYAKKINNDVVAVVFGNLSDGELNELGEFGANNVVLISDAKFEKPSIMTYSSVLSEVMNMKSATALVMAKSTLTDAMSGRIAVKNDASLAQNVMEIPEGNKVKCSIFSGKAFAFTQLNKDKSIFVLKKGAIDAVKIGGSIQKESVNITISDSDFSVQTLKIEKLTGKVLLQDAEIVVSAGRGLKGPENWTMIEELADVLNAATACSKPVSDIDWRPHSEHVGQTGIKVSPNLYFAIGISGAIQHLAGVNGSKVIVVINTDAEAPFFKSADYGIVGDAFQVVPKLIEALKK